MISFAGVGLTPPSNADEIIGRFWHKNAIQQFGDPFYTATGGLDHLPMPAAPARTPPRIGVLTWPTTASKWAVCNLLATGEQLAAIGPTTQQGILMMGDGFHDPLPFQMWMLPARPISQRGAKELYLLTFVDERYFWWQKGSSASAGDDSWSGMIGTMLSGVGASAFIPGVPSGYGKPNVLRWVTNYKPLPPLIDAAAQTIGLRLVRYPNGVNIFQNYTSATEDATAQWEAFQYETLAGGLISTADIARSVPGSVGIEFSGEDWAEVVVRSLGSAEIDEFTGLSGTSAVGHIFGDLYKPGICADRGTKEIYEGAKPRYADQAAEDYFGWYLADTDATFRGLVGRMPTGFDECVEWVHPASGEMVTRVIRRPFADMNIYGDRGRMAYEIIQEEGIDLQQRPRMNFIGDGITASDNIGCNRTDITLAPILNQISNNGSGGGSGKGNTYTTYNNTTSKTTTYYDYNNDYNTTTTNTYNNIVITLGGSGGSGTTGLGCIGQAILGANTTLDAQSAIGANGPGWVAGLQTTDCLSASIYDQQGSCVSVAGPQTTIMTWDGSGWVSTTNVATSGVTGTMRFWLSAGEPHLSIGGIELIRSTGGSGGGGACDASGGMGGSTASSVDFYGGTALSMCPANTVGCSINTFRVRVTCGCCPPLTVSLSVFPASGQVSLAVAFNAIIPNGTPPYTYYWVTGNGNAVEGKQNQLNYAYDTVGTYTPSVTVTDACGKTAIAYASVMTTAPPPPPPPFTPGTTCATAGVAVVGTTYAQTNSAGALTYQWYNYGVLSAGTYHVTFTGLTGNDTMAAGPGPCAAWAADYMLQNTPGTYSFTVDGIREVIVQQKNGFGHSSVSYTMVLGNGP